MESFSLCRWADPGVRVGVFGTVRGMHGRNWECQGLAQSVGTSFPSNQLLNEDDFSSNMAKV